MKCMFLSFNGCLCRGIGTCSNKESRPLEYFMVFSLANDVLLLPSLPFTILVRIQSVKTISLTMYKLQFHLFARGVPTVGGVINIGRGISYRCGRSLLNNILLPSNLSSQKCSYSCFSKYLITNCQSPPRKSFFKPIELQKKFK